MYGAQGSTVEKANFFRGGAFDDDLTSQTGAVSDLNLHALLLLVVTGTVKIFAHDAAQDDAVPRTSAEVGDSKRVEFRLRRHRRHVDGRLYLEKDLHERRI